MSKSIRMSENIKEKMEKKAKPAAKPAAKKAAPKPPQKKAVKAVVSSKINTKAIPKQMSVSANNKPSKATTNPADKKNLRPMQLTANDGDVVANSKFRSSAKDLD